MSMSKANPIAVEAISGVWYLSPLQRTDGSWLLERDSGNPMGQRHRFEFHANGEFVKGYAAPRGMDESTHHWSGIWQWNDGTGILFVQVNRHRKLASDKQPTKDYLQGRKFHVTEASDKRLVLLPLA
jgi:hypothetical protein